MLLKILEGKGKGRFVEYNEVGKVLTLLSGKSLKVEETIIDDIYILKNGAHEIKLIKEKQNDENNRPR